MSTLYNLEPQPTAKVLLQTTAGDILLELFAKQIPLASRNFLQLCLDNYYDNTIFHRFVPNFIIQGGDPTGTGSGGESSYDGEPFADEFHSRLRFNRRGLLGMANTGRKDDNGSQFFLTLDKAEELNGKNTMFGRVVGDTIYNLMKIGDAELADPDGDRPLYPVKITGTEILVNPFEDMVKRTATAKPSMEVKRDKAKPKRKAGKQLLSFGGDEGEEGFAVHVPKKAKFNPKLVSAGQEDGVALDNPSMPKAPPKSPEETHLISAGYQDGNGHNNTAIPAGPDREASKKHAKKPVSISPSASPSPPRKILPKAVPERTAPAASRSPTPEPVEKITSLLEKTNAQIAQLKASMRRNIPTAPAEAPRKKSALEAMIPETSIRGRKRKLGGNNSSHTDEQRALDMFNAFKSKLDSVPTAPPVPSPAMETDSIKLKQNGAADTANLDPAELDAADEEAALCDLHFIANCMSCTVWDNNHSNDRDSGSLAVGPVADDDGGTGWMSHALSFAKDRLGKDLEWKRKNEEELVVIDPREKAKELKVEGRRKNDGKDQGGSSGRNRGLERDPANMRAAR